MTLHIFNSSEQYRKKIKLASSSDDAVVLIEEAVYIAIETINSDARVYVLTEDVTARGLQELVKEGFDKIDYAGFVELSEAHKKSITW